VLYQASPLRMAQLLLVHREPAFVTRDRISGGWIHRYRRGTLVSPKPRGLPWQLAEQKTMDIFFHRRTPQSGDTVLEIGAEYGADTVFLSRLVGPEGRVIAVEAHPGSCSLLGRTVELNGLMNVEVVNAAISDTNGTTEISDGASVSNRVVSDGSGVAVPAMTIDRLVERFDVDRIDLLKMNIEGSERQALAGLAGSQHLVRHAVISCHDFLAETTGDEFFRTSEVVDKALSSWGFTIHRRSDDPRAWIRDYRYAERRGSQN
jgi:FkbM family methyltransferase